VGRLTVLADVQSVDWQEDRAEAWSVAHRLVRVLKARRINGVKVGVRPSCGGFDVYVVVPQEA